MPILSHYPAIKNNECYSMYIITYLFHNTTINWTHFKLFFILAHVKLYHRNKRYTNMVHIAFRHFPSAQSCFPNEYAKHNSIASAEIKEIEFNMSNLTSNLKLRTLLLQNCVAWFLVFDWFSNSVIMRRVYFLFWKSFDSLSGLWGLQLWRITAKNTLFCV